MRRTARAHTNIALVKYWGKADESLILPASPSISLTVDGLSTTTSVDFGTHPGRDDVWLDGSRLVGTPYDRVVAFLDLVRAQAGIDAAARVESRNDVPTAAGLASSASGFAALAAAATRSAGLSIDDRSLSRLARRGSGSASRSIFGGLAIWHAGTDDDTSYAEPIAPGLELSIVVVAVDTRKKSLSSRAAMRATVQTSPFYDAWITQTISDCAQALGAIERDDFSALGRITESNALRMHATIMASDPGIIYWEPATLEVLSAVRSLREDGLEAYSTMDAGPNVKVLVRSIDAERLADRLASLRLGSVSVHGAGPGIEYLEEEAA